MISAKISTMQVKGWIPQTLPIDEHLSSISRLYATHPILVVISAPGTGKTTRIPRHLAEHLPRR